MRPLSSAAEVFPRLSLRPRLCAAIARPIPSPSACATLPRPAPIGARPFRSSPIRSALACTFALLTLFFLHRQDHPPVTPALPRLAGASCRRPVSRLLFFVRLLRLVPTPHGDLFLRALFLLSCLAPGRCPFFLRSLHFGAASFFSPRLALFGSAALAARRFFLRPAPSCEFARPSMESSPLRFFPPRPCAFRARPTLPPDVAFESRAALGAAPCDAPRPAFRPSPALDAHRRTFRFPPTLPLSSVAPLVGATCRVPGKVTPCSTFLGNRDATIEGAGRSWSLAGPPQAAAERTEKTGWGMREGGKGATGMGARWAALRARRRTRLAARGMKQRRGRGEIGRRRRRRGGGGGRESQRQREDAGADAGGGVKRGRMGGR